MDPKTAEALEASIAKWERNATAETPEGYTLGAETCPLCHLFFHNSCAYCPVFNETGCCGCVNTPYERAILVEYFWKTYPNNPELKAKAHKAARAEVAFLKSLRDEPASEPRTASDAAPS